MERANEQREGRIQLKFFKKYFLKSNDEACHKAINLRIYDNRRIKSMDIRRVRPKRRRLPKMEGKEFKSFDIDISKNLHDTQLVKRYLRLRASKSLERSIKGYKNSGGSSTFIPED